MSRLTLIIVFTASLVLMLAVLTPLRLVLDMAGVDELGLSADRVEGPFWGGRVIGARAGVMPLGDLKVSVNPFVLMLAGDDADRLRAVTVRDGSGERIPLDGFAAYRPSGP
ncbi:MAG: hypothetical protein ACI8U3_003065 [Brevundimonas sp.]|uniref:hypothetical protein n=1 Tax=Brevundimonas sp. TaxID=1871086 RepID=UPI0039E464E3